MASGVSRRDCRFTLMQAKQPSFHLTKSFDSYRYPNIELRGLKVRKANIVTASRVQRRGHLFRGSHLHLGGGCILLKFLAEVGCSKQNHPLQM
jgi:hypothetical protein